MKRKGNRDAARALAEREAKELRRARTLAFLPTIRAFTCLYRASKAVLRWRARALAAGHMLFNEQKLNNSLADELADQKARVYELEVELRRAHENNARDVQGGK